MVRLIFCLVILLGYNAQGQIKVTGHLKDMSGNPISSFIHVNVQSIIYSDSAGYFEASTSSDSLVLVFRADGYKMKKVKVLKSENIEVKLITTFVSKAGDVFENGTNPEPISKIENENGTTEIYSIDTIRLVRNMNQKMVVWKLDKYDVYLPFDSLIHFLNIAPYRPDDISFGLDFLKKHSNNSIVRLSKGFVERIGKRVLDDFAVEMIKENSIKIAGKTGTIERIIVMDSFWNGPPKCRNCCWGGLQFLVNGTDALFSRTSIIC